MSYDDHYRWCLLLCRDLHLWRPLCYSCLPVHSILLRPQLRTTHLARLNHAADCRRASCHTSTKYEARSWSEIRLSAVIELCCAAESTSQSDPRCHPSFTLDDGAFRNAFRSLDNCHRIRRPNRLVTIRTLHPTTYTEHVFDVGLLQTSCTQPAWELPIRKPSPLIYRGLKPDLSCLGYLADSDAGHLNHIWIRD